MLNNKTSDLKKCSCFSRWAVKALVLSGLFATLSVQANSEALNAEHIAQRVDAADSGWQDEEVKAQMTLYAADGRSVSREIRSRSLEVSDDGDRSLVVFDQPLDVKGTVFLTHTHDVGNDDQWLFLPALKRTKRIASSNRSGPFMGSEFAYEDISSEEVSRYTYDDLRSAACGEPFAAERQCHIYNRYPVDKSSGYTRQQVYVDQEHYRVLKIDYYDRKNSHQKTLTRNDYQKFGNYWRAKQWVMQNHLNQKKTVVEWSDWKFSSGFQLRDFERSALSRYR